MYPGEKCWWEMYVGENSVCCLEHRDVGEKYVDDIISW